MIRNYFLSAIRNLLRNRTFSIINVTGLIIGLATFLVIFQYVRYEISFDKFHENAKSIYRIYDKGVIDGKPSDWTQTPAPLAAFIKNHYPQVKNTVRIAKTGKQFIKTLNKSFYEPGLILADSTILNVFTIPLVTGNSKTGLEKPNSILITQTTAKKYFGDSNPIGSTLTLNNKHDFIVTGVLKDIPSNSHFHFDFLISLKNADSVLWKGFLENQMNTVVFTYIQLYSNTDVVDFRNKMKNLQKDYFNLTSPTTEMNYYIQPLADIHLYSSLGGEFEPNSNILYIYIFTLIGFLILIIACVNFTNLSIALYHKRLPEIGLRKILGATRPMIIQMFYIEAFIVFVLSLNFAVILTKLFLPWFSVQIGKNLALDLNDKYFIIIVLILVPLGVLLSGSYPALYISKFKSLTIIKKEIISQNRKLSIKHILLLFQFIISISLIISTIVIINQGRYIQNKNLGYNKESLLVLPLSGANVSDKIDIIKSSFLQNPNILNITQSSDIPGDMKWVTSIKYEGLPDGTNPPTMVFLVSDRDFVPTYNLKILEGKNFSNTEGINEYLLNQSAVKLLGWKNPLGKKFTSYYGGDGTVTGVINDFHFKTLYNEIEPIFITRSKRGINFLTIRLNNQNIQETLSYIKNKWKEVAKDKPCDYFFYDDFFNKLYNSEINLGKLILAFTFVAILIACLGLFGLVTYVTESRTKEIGIRRVNGATQNRIILLISSDLLKWVLIAFVLACPLGYYAMNKWLQNFAYKTGLSWWVFAVAGLVAGAVALLTVSWQAYKASNCNPVKTLRYE